MSVYAVYCITGVMMWIKSIIDTANSAGLECEHE